MVVIPSGSFQMGDLQGKQENELPVHTVKIQKPFAIGRYEVTFEEYDQFARATGREEPRDEGHGRGKQPVINVSWNDAEAYAQWLSQQTTKHYRMPTEAEWEYAARAGTETSYWWGNEEKPGVANSGRDRFADQPTQPVGSLRPNPFGLYDTAGNVWEWVADCWHGNYHGSPADEAAWKIGSDDCNYRVIQGGAWYIALGNLRASFRNRSKAVERNDDIGFRLARDLD
jgi:formylglycine-generating enzyme required for sulfatase activity